MPHTWHCCLSFLTRRAPQPLQGTQRPLATCLRSWDADKIPACCTTSLHAWRGLEYFSVLTTVAWRQGSALWWASSTRHGGGAALVHQRGGGTGVRVSISAHVGASIRSLKFWQQTAAFGRRGFTVLLQYVLVKGRYIGFGFGGFGEGFALLLLTVGLG